MRVRYTTLALETMVIVACYLVISISFVSAVEVRVVSGGVTYGTVQSSDFDTSALVTRTITTAGYPNIQITAKNGTQDYQVVKVYVYKCKGMNPGQCVSSGSMESFGGNFNVTYQWSDLADQTSTYPQTANILIVAKLQKLGLQTWVGYWHSVKRTGSSVFQQSSYPTLGSVELEAESAGLVNSIINYIKGRKMLPFSWAKKVTFSVGNTLYELATDNIAAPAFSGSQKSGSQIDLLGREYDIVFPNFPDVSGIMDAVTLYSNPGYTCGNGVCETPEGESESNCCLDCLCSGTGYYCDLGFGCRSLGQVSLALYGTPQTAVQNCNEQHTMNIRVEVKNKPTGSTITGTSYVLGGGSPQSTTCALYSGNVYTCQVVVPPAIPCVGSEFRLAGNSITFAMKYNDGGVEKTMERSVSFPDVVVGSWTCGDGSGSASHFRYRSF